MKKIILAVLSLLVIAIFITGCVPEEQEEKQEKEKINMNSVKEKLAKIRPPKKVVKEEPKEDTTETFIADLGEEEGELDSLDEELNFSELDELMEEDLAFE